MAGARPLVLALALAALASLAGGCVTEPTESRCDAREFVSIFYDRVLDPPTLERGLESYGYEWRSESGRIAYATPPPSEPQDVRVVVSERPGASGTGTVIAVEETTDLPTDPDRAIEVARDVAGAVNGTFANDIPQIVEWIEGEHTPTC